MKLLFPLLMTLVLAGCSVFGESEVKNAPYTLLKSDQAKQIEVRNYESMVLVSSSMSADGMNGAFRNLFKYITGENEGSAEIAMTAPVLMNESEAVSKGTEIAMTAPVFMKERSEQQVMSFVMPADFTIQSTPKPTNPDVWVTEVKDYKVVVIKFSGLLSDSNVETQTQILNKWIEKNGYTAISEPINAAYNGPFTIPWLRHNEVLIEVI
jgi:SOUL heme-binding protein